MTKTFNCDCLTAMKDYPDKYFDLAVVDPPYGGGATDPWANKKRGRFGSGIFKKYRVWEDVGENKDEETVKKILEAAPIKTSRTGGGWSKRYQGGANDIRNWDLAPSKEYFEELFRISKNQIIWGGNYFDLPPTRCFLVWDKRMSENFSMAMCEYAWTSFNSNAKLFQYMPQDKSRFHPTQKPVPLYSWIYKLYARPGDKILDTHMGSQSSRIAAYEAGLDYVGYELDPVFYELGEKRFAEYTAQESLFDRGKDEDTQEQLSMFGDPEG